MRVPFLDLKTQYQSIRSEIATAVERVLDSTHYILGPEVSGFEEAFAKAHQTKYCITSNNGTSALHLALWALGIKRGDEIILPVNTFIATAEAVLLTGATPIFVDHDEYYCIDPDDVERKITRRTKAIMPVHLYGQPAEMTGIAAIAKQYNLKIVEDAAQAHLAAYGDKFVGSWGDATGFSFYPGKNLGAYGEGGAVLTNSEVLNEQMRRLRDHGSEAKYNHIVAGHNYRLEALQAAILNVKLRHLTQWTEMRRSHAKKYSELLEGCTQIQLPKEREAAKSVYHLFVVQADRRDDLREFLDKKEIGTGLHYPIPLHLQPCFQYLGYKEGAFPRAERSSKRIVSLPMYPEITDDHIAFVASSIREFYSGISAK
jgi:dTDP-4-amino-4,6-dideoxygalactose transaminase